MPHTLTRDEHAENHAEKLADLIEILKKAWIKRIRDNDAKSITDLHNCVLDRLSEDACKELFTLALDAPGAAGGPFAELVAQVMHDQCEAAAKRQIAWIEKMRRIDGEEPRNSRAEDRQATSMRIFIVSVRTMAVVATVIAVCQTSSLAAEAALGLLDEPCGITVICLG